MTPPPAEDTDGVSSVAPVAPVAPVRVPTRRVVEAGSAAWALALAVLLAVPDLHTGDRSWWPWCAVCGLALGGIGWVYVRRGRGNAADA